MEKGRSIVYTPHIDKMDLEVINDPLFFCVLQETCSKTGNLNQAT